MLSVALNITRVASHLLQNRGLIQRPTGDLTDLCRGSNVSSLFLLVTALKLDEDESPCLTSV